MSLRAFIQGRTIHGWAEPSASQTVVHSSPGILDKSKLCRVSEEAMQKQA